MPTDSTKFSVKRDLSDCNWPLSLNGKTICGVEVIGKRGWKFSFADGTVLFLNTQKIEGEIS